MKVLYIEGRDSDGDDDIEIDNISNLSRESLLRLFEEVLFSAGLNGFKNEFVKYLGNRWGLTTVAR